MNKAKMTFRFENSRPPGKRESRPQPIVIPLRAEEYQVIEQGELSGKTDIPAFVKQREAEPVASGLTDPPQKGGFTSEIRPLNDFTTDFGGWQSSFDMETKHVEALIRASRTETSEDEPEEESTWRERPRGRANRTGPIMDEGAYYRTTGGGSWLKIAASVTGAVVTGVAFGFLVLSMFSGQAPAPADRLPATAGGTLSSQTPPGKETASAAAKAGQTAAAPVSASAPGAAVNLPARSYTFLQGGVFGTAQSAESAAADFRKKGLAAASEAGEKHTVFVGMGVSREEALGLSRTFEQKQIEVLLKSYEIPAVTKVRWNGKQADLFQTYMTQGDKLIQLIAAQTITRIGAASPPPLDEKTAQTIKATHQSWSSTASAVSDGLGEAGKTALPRMNSALNTAVALLEEYKKTPSAASLWQAQTAMMQYIVAEKELLKSAALS